MASLIDNTTIVNAEHIYYTQQRKLVKTSDGKLVIFAVTIDVDWNEYIQYKVSSDGGSSWGSWITAIDCTNEIGENTENFDLCIDANDNIYLVCTDDYSIWFRILTYSSGTWSNGTLRTVYTYASYIRYLKPSICLKSNGDIWIAVVRRNTNYFRWYYSTDSGASWSNSSIDTGNLVQCVYIYPISTGIYTLVNSAGTILQYVVGGSGSTVVSSVTSTSYIGVVKISDTEVWLFYDKSTGMEVMMWNGSSWSSATALSEDATDEQPGLSNINSKPIAVFMDFDDSTWKLTYRVYDGASWGAKTVIATDGTLVGFSVLDNHASKLVLLFTKST
jgi:hypothetical protein